MKACHREGSLFFPERLQSSEVTRFVGDIILSIWKQGRRYHQQDIIRCDRCEPGNRHGAGCRYEPARGGQREEAQHYLHHGR